MSITIGKCPICGNTEILKDRGILNEYYYEEAFGRVYENLSSQDAVWIASLIASEVDLDTICKITVFGMYHSSGVFRDNIDNAISYYTTIAYEYLKKKSSLSEGESKLLEWLKKNRDMLDSSTFINQIWAW